MASSISTLEASSSTSNPDSYEVFLSFRGEDTRKNFTDHLYNTLVANGIHTFRDDEELEKGGDIASDLLRAIEESKIFIIIFSKNYATSKWCLNELVKIIDCMTKKESVVLPVFYHVEPTDVRNQGGSFKDAFLEHAKDADQEKEKTIETWKNALKTAGERKRSFGDAFLGHAKDADQEKEKTIETWKKALKTAASLSGYHVDDQYETEAINEIITNINRRLKPLNVRKDIIGIDFHLEKLKSFMNTELNAICVVGICGIGGIGKTTVAKALYNDISYQFQGSCFLENVREGSKGNVVQLQQKLLHGILKGKSLKVSNDEEGISMIKRCLKGKRVLVVLDDVDNFVGQLEFLAGEHDWFGTKSVIIITTRDTHVLDPYGMNALSYEIEKLNDDDAIKLFSRWAFKQNLPPEAYINLSHSVIEYAKGLPLALKVLGSFFLDKTISQWKEALPMLRKIPNMEIQNVLKISYDGLKDIEKEIFLDIACFFKGEDKYFVSRILDNNYVECGISALQKKCLITVLENKLDMHDLIQQMGYDIIRQECPKEPGKWSRLWDPEDIYRVLRRNTGTDSIEGIFLAASGSKQIQFTTEAFKMMKRLRLLKIHQEAKYESIVESYIEVDEVQLPKMHLPVDFQIPSDDLIFLHWDAYSLESLPSNFQADNLVELHLRCSNIKQPWEGIMVFSKLKVIDLSFSVHLIKISDFSSVPNLEILILDGCNKLVGLPSDIYTLKRLQKLSCFGCLGLESFPEIKGVMKKLTELDLSWTGIKELPSSLVKHLKGLNRLNLIGCENLVHVPKSICGLSSLKALRLADCPKLDKLPEDMGSLPSLKLLELNSLRCELPCLSGLSSLRVLSLQDSNITEEVIPSNNCLSSLKELDLSYSDLMEQGLPNHIFGLSSLEELHLRGNHFTSIPADISKLSILRSLDLSHCEKLLQIPELPSSLRRLDTHSSPVTFSSLWSLLKCFKSAIQETECGNSLNQKDSEYSFTGVEFIPGICDIPKWIDYHRMGSATGINLPQDWYQDNDFLGVAIGCVYVLPDDKSYSESGHSSEDESDNSENESEGEESHKKSAHISLECYMTINCHDLNLKHEDFMTYTADCWCYEDAKDMESDKMWVMYYPKVAIPEKFHSKQWTKLFASFDGSNHFGKALKVKKSVIHLIYDQAHQSRDLVGTFSDHENSCSMCQLDRVHEFKFKLCLEGSDFNELPTIECPSAIEILCLRNCKNLESLPSEICKLKSLKGLFCSGCLKLESFPEIMENMENLRELYLDETAIEELPSSIERLQGLQHLYLAGCENLVSLPESICNLRSLTTLVINYCSKLQKLPENLGGLHSLEELHAACLDSISCQLPYLSGLCSFRVLDLKGLNLMQGAIPNDICCLYSLKVLNLSKCNLIEGGIPSEIYHLSSLQALYLGGNHFSSIAGVNKLSKLRVLNLSHCKKLRQIPELPSSLRFLDIHSCTSLESLSSSSSLLPSCLFKCFKSTIQDFEDAIITQSETYVRIFSSYSAHELRICISSSGNQGWLRCDQNEGSKVSSKLPRNWYKNNDLLGFALCSVHVPPNNESEDESEDGLEKQETQISESGNESEDGLEKQETQISESGNESEDGLEKQETQISESDNESEDGLEKQETQISESDNESEGRLDDWDTWKLERKFTIGDSHRFQIMDSVTFQCSCDCGIDDDVSSQVWVTYHPKIRIPREYAPNKRRVLLKAEFQGYFKGEPVKVENCGIHLIYAHEQEPSR